VPAATAIIDFHTHPVFFKAGASRAELARLRAHARALGIVRMVVLGDVLVHGQFPSEAEVRAINDTTAQLMRAYPDFFLGFCFLNPVLGEKPVRREIERCIGGLGFRGLKLETCINARAACMKPLMREAERHDLPVLQHTWTMTHRKGRRYESDPADTTALARRYPNTKVVMAHLTGCGVRGVLLAKGIDNLWVDTSAGLPKEGLVALACKHLGEDRVLHGSDLPIREPSVTIARVRAAEISPRAKEKILYRNAAQLLRLESAHRP
jgi:predicted TIM-barrel fold metal-dependent hydrolase